MPCHAKAIEMSEPAPAPAHGIHAVLYAFFDANEALDRSAMRQQVNAVVETGVVGINLLGLATEVGKLSIEERTMLIKWLAEDVGGRLPFSVTINGPTVADQLRQVRVAEDAGAAWLVLQPPVVGTFAASEYIDFFARVAAGVSIPAAVQNAPAYFGRALSPGEVHSLFTAQPLLKAVKGEGAAVDIDALVRSVGHDIPVFNGRGGLEMIDSLRAGCAGLVLAPDLVDHAVAIYSAYESGKTDAAERRYAAVLPAITFVMQSLEGLVVYGKRLFAARAGMGAVHDRRPSLQPTEFGLAIVERLARTTGRFSRQDGN